MLAEVQINYSLLQEEKPMERYVIVCLLDKEVLDFHEELVTKLCQKFNVKRQALPAHFTIKAPFEREKIDDIIELTKNYTELNSKEKILIKGISNFRDNVIYLPIHPWKEAANLNDSYFNKLKNIQDLDFKKNESLEKVYHCTILSHLKNPMFREIRTYIDEYLGENTPNFESYFSNISILRWNRYKWDTFKRFDFR